VLAGVDAEPLLLGGVRAAAATRCLTPRSWTRCCGWDVHTEGAAGCSREMGRVLVVVCVGVCWPRTAARCAHNIAAGESGVRAAHRPAQRAVARRLSLSFLPRSFSLFFFFLLQLLHALICSVRRPARCCSTFSTGGVVSAKLHTKNPTFRLAPLSAPPRSFLSI
jgi:hypothetical protein